MRRRLWFPIAALFIAASIAMTACGSDDDESSSTSTKTVSENTLEAASERAEAAMKRPTEVAVTEPLGEEVPKDKTVYWLECSIEACTALGDTLQDAMDALGWKLRRVNGGLEPETMKAAWEVAARDKPDAVIGGGFPQAIFERQLQELVDADIPVVNIINTDVSIGDSEYILKGPKDYLENGALNADWVVNEGGEATKALYITSSQFPSVEKRAEGFKNQFDKVCPDCTLETVEAQAEDIGTNALPTQIVGRLQQDPDINLLVLGVGDMLTGLGPALKSAGLQERIDVLVSDMSPDIYQAMQNGEVDASVMQEGVDTMWEATDILLRHFTDQPVTVHTDPAQRWIVTPENSKDWGPPFPLVADMEEQYKALWGVDQ